MKRKEEGKAKMRGNGRKGKRQMEGKIKNGKSKMDKNESRRLM